MAGGGAGAGGAWRECLGEASKPRDDVTCAGKTPVEALREQMMDWETQFTETSPAVMGPLADPLPQETSGSSQGAVHVRARGPGSSPGSRVAQPPGGKLGADPNTDTRALRPGNPASGHLP